MSFFALGLLSYNFNPPSALFCARGRRGELVDPRSPCHWHSAVEVSSTCAPPRRLCIDKKSQAVHFHHAYLQKSLSCFLIFFIEFISLLDFIIFAGYRFPLKNLKDTLQPSYRCQFSCTPDFSG